MRTKFETEVLLNKFVMYIKNQLNQNVKVIRLLLKESINTFLMLLLTFFFNLVYLKHIGLT